MKTHIDQAFILAAGFGTRLRPYTDDRPKPLVEVAGQSILSRILDHLENADIRHVVINLHYRGRQIMDHLQTRTTPHIQYSQEAAILNTGGGIRHGLPLLQPRQSFFVINGDALWSDGPGQSALQRLTQAWEPSKMDILMLLMPVAQMTLTTGAGDYDCNINGLAIRNRNKTGAFMFTGIRLNHPRIFKDAPEGPFSYLELMDRAQDQGRLYALVHEGSWHHVSTPQDYQNVDDAYRKNEKLDD